MSHRIEQPDVRGVFQPVDPTPRSGASGRSDRRTAFDGRPALALTHGQTPFGRLATGAPVGARAA
jgi:hypothetical protein